VLHSLVLLFSSRSRSGSAFQWIKNVFQIEASASSEQNDDPYMDDLILPSKDNNLDCPTKKCTDILSIPTNEAVTTDLETPHASTLHSDDEHDEYTSPLNNNEALMNSAV
jgi:hypothetical protein